MDVHEHHGEMPRLARALARRPHEGEQLRRDFGIDVVVLDDQHVNAGQRGFVEMHVRDRPRLILFGNRFKRNVDRDVRAPADFALPFRPS